MDRICSSASCRCSMRLRSECQVRTLNSLLWFLGHSWAVFAVWQSPLSCWRGPLPSRSAWSLKSKNLNLNWAVFILTLSQNPPRSGLEIEAKNVHDVGFFSSLWKHIFFKSVQNLCLFSLFDSHATQFDSIRTAFPPPNGTLYLAGFDVGCGLKGHFSLGISEQRQSIWDYGSPAK